MGAMQMGDHRYGTAVGILGLAMTIGAQFALVTTRLGVGPVQGLVDVEQVPYVFTVVDLLVDGAATVRAANQLIFPEDGVFDVLGSLNCVGGKLN